MDNLNFNSIVFDLLQIRRCPSKSTKVFKKLDHNEYLCPLFQQKLESIFSSFERYYKIVYDIQGVKDNGTDILLKEIAEGFSKHICFQIKSERDLSNDSYLKNLKSQYFDTKRSFSDVQCYYIVLCCNTYQTTGKKRKALTPDIDLVKSLNKNKIRLIEGEFAGIEDVKVIEPEFAINFLQLSIVQIDAILRSKLGNEDIVYQKGLDIVAELTPTEKTIIYIFMIEFIYMNRYKLSIQELSCSDYLAEITLKTPNWTREDFVEDKTDVLENERDFSEESFDLLSRIDYAIQNLLDIYLSYNMDGTISLNIETVQPLLIFMLDANQRYGYEGPKLISYMIDLFGKIGSFNFSEDQVIDNAMLIINI